MNSCCICQFSVRNPKDIHTETLGKPPILLSDLVLQCTKGTNYVLGENTLICKKCYEKLSRYHKSLQIARKQRQEILDLIRASYIVKDAQLKDEDEDKEENGHMTVELVEAVNVADLEEACNPTIVDLSGAVHALEVVEEEEVEEEPEMQEYLEKGSDDDELEFQSVNLELDIENEIIINEEAPEADIESEDKETNPELDRDMLSEYEDQTDGTIEYLISEVDDQDSSGDYTVNIQCPSCPEQFSSRRAYNAHTKREHFPGYVCDQCGKTLQSYSGFIGHLQNHEPVKQFECPHCGERFSRKFRLKHHMAWHTGETPYQCDVCSKRFVHKVALYKHKMIHDTESKRLECQVCGFKTRTKAHLDRHSRSHTGAKPFACPVCNKRFSQMYNMKAHLREHENPGSTRHRRFHCTKCTHTFINEQNYASHCERNDCTPV
ncbi:CG7928 [Drosophila busckii]|uniref:Zinc finger protein 865 n=1 Tax=Drosophila busckii TaxID=30019 RepID=A0A0M4ENI5_DROBS|nr:zinc finger protein interacting with ribonucleoprotein K [Drosophila busckii]ALC46264.1 CG7928 [Drosophila busckii]